MCEQRTYTNDDYCVYYKLCNEFYRLLEDLFKSETFDSQYNMISCNIRRIFIKYQPTVKSRTQWYKIVYYGTS